MLPRNHYPAQIGGMQPDSEAVASVRRIHAAGPSHEADPHGADANDSCLNAVVPRRLAGRDRLEAGKDETGWPSVTETGNGHGMTTETAFARHM
jgi:hypothetical protein